MITLLEILEGFAIASASVFASIYFKAILAIFFQKLFGRSAVFSDVYLLLQIIEHAMLT